MYRGILILLVGVSLLSACKPRKQEAPSQHWLRWQCAGTDVLGGTNETVFPQLGALAPTSSLRDALVSRAIESVLKRFQPGTNALSPDTLDAWRPLVELALRREHLLEIHGDESGPKTWLLAVRIEKERVEKMGMDMSHLKDEARVFEKAYKDTIEALQLPEPERFNLRYCGGWYSTLPDETIADFLEVGPWVIFGTGERRQPMLDALERAVATGSPGAVLGENWARLEIDCEKFPLAARLAPKWKSLQVEFAPRGANLMVDGRVELRAPFEGELPQWAVPTGLVRDPLLSFAATRRVEEWFSPLPAALEPKPAQFFVWAQSPVPFFTQAAAPVSDATAALGRWSAVVPQWLKDDVLGGARGTFETAADVGELRWKGLPLLSPVLAATNDAGTGFLHLSLFPTRPGTPPAPPELLAQIDREELVHYGWEITGERAKQWRHLQQLWGMVRLDAGPAGALARQDWIEAAAPLLGNTVTEIQRTGATELKITRKGPIGLGAFELIQIASHLDLFLSGAAEPRVAPPGFPMPPGL